MLPALVLFRPKGRDLQGRGAFLRYGIPMPSGRNVIASLAFFIPLRDADFSQSTHANLWNTVASRRPGKIRSPHLRIALAPRSGASGIGMPRRRPFIPPRQVTPMQIIPPYRAQLTSPAPMGGSLNAGRGRSPYLLWKIVVFLWRPSLLSTIRTITYPRPISAAVRLRGCLRTMVREQP